MEKEKSLQEIKDKDVSEDESEVSEDLFGKSEGKRSPRSDLEEKKEKTPEKNGEEGEIVSGGKMGNIHQDDISLVKKAAKKKTKQKIEGSLE
jgi:hypothetical protein